MKKNQKGFTLIELLVVIAILGLLATLAIVSLRGAQQRARDTKRITDVKSMQTALELYYSETPGGYPEPSSWTNLETLLGPYITGLPKPPNASEQYIYGVESANNQNYVVGALSTGLENTGHQALTQDADGSFGNGGTTEDWGANTVVVVSGGNAPNPALINCADPAYCLVE